MKTVTYPHGVVLTYDETIKAGDIITAYRSGWHRVTKIVERNDSTPIIYYIKVMGKDGALSKSKVEQCCDASYCHKMDLETIELNLKTQINFCNEISDKLKSLLPGEQDV